MTVHRWNPSLRLTLLLGITLGSLTGCASNHSALLPATRQAEAIAQLWWHFFFICGAIYLVVIAHVFAVRLRRRRTSTAVPRDQLAEVPDDSRTLKIISLLTGLTVLILAVLFVDDLIANRTLGPVSDQNAINISLTGHQWWWEAEYQDPLPANVFVTANEIHFPVHRTVNISLQSPDVIHSLWVPALHGKKDLVPGHPATLTLQADKPGTYRGQCAEFCGAQHAHMAIEFIAESPEAFAEWQNAQRNPSVTPTTEPQRRGQALFLSGTCVMCHTIGGTLARSRVGPDLTHLASQQMIGAATLANTRDNLRSWIRDPQAVKPGVRMPPSALSKDDLETLLDYLQSLK